MGSDAFHRAVDLLGGRDAFLAALGISLRTYATWKRDGVPDTRWRAVAQATGGRVTERELAAHRAERLSTPAEAA